MIMLETIYLSTYTKNYIIATVYNRDEFDKCNGNSIRNIYLSFQAADP